MSGEGKRYHIYRIYRDGEPSRLVRKVFSLEEAQAHCRREDTRGVHPTKGPWFDGYEEVL